MIPHLPTAVLLDRDGVINEPVVDPRTGAFESPYVPRDVQLVDGVVEAIRAIEARAIPIAVVSNQPAAAKQTHSLRELAEVDMRVRELLAERGIEIAVWRYCHHHPNGTDPVLAIDCDCRKPKPGLLVSALEALGVPASSTVVILGDGDADIGAGQALGIATVLVEHPASAHRRGTLEPDFRVTSAEQWSKVAATDV